jgi:AhpC/TSA family
LRRLPFILPLALFAVLAAYFGLGLLRDPAVLPSALIDHPAPDFTLPGLADKPGLANADLAGNVVLVNFFSSWCVPCRVEHPMSMRFAAEDRIYPLGDRPQGQARRRHPPAGRARQSVPSNRRRQRRPDGDRSWRVRHARGTMTAPSVALLLIVGETDERACKRSRRPLHTGIWRSFLTPLARIFGIFLCLGGRSPRLRRAARGAAGRSCARGVRPDLAPGTPVE